MRRLWPLFLGLFATVAPFALAELGGGREALGAITGGQGADFARALGFVAAWVWMVFASVPLAAGGLAWFAARPRP